MSHSATHLFVLVLANKLGFVGHIKTHRMVESSIKYNPEQDPAQTLSTGCAYVVGGHFSMHWLLYPNNEGHVGHNVVIHDIVVGSANVTPGHVATH